MSESSETGLVFDIQRFSIHDGPGIRTTVFMKGCPLHCSWCHNPESQAPVPQLLLYPERCIGCAACLEACQYGAIVSGPGGTTTDLALCAACGACTEACYAEARVLAGRAMTVDQVMAEVERDVAFYDQSGGGVTFSGGEPLAQPGFLLALLQAARRRGLHTALDTCGYAPWPVLDRVRPYVDVFLYDLKLMDDARHREATGVSNEVILDNARALAAAGHRLRLRVPLIPGVNDDDANLRALAVFAAALSGVEGGLEGGLQGIDLLAYHPTAREKYRRLNRAYPLPDLEPPSGDDLAAVVQRLRAAGNDVRIGG
jgi:pyruvate formate lyase activating enzyme